MLEFDKEQVKEEIELNQIYSLLEEWGAEPSYIAEGIVAKTVCHCGSSKKLYIYGNTKLCRCYTGCDEPTFDIFELVKRVVRNQQNIELNLNESVRYVAKRIGYKGHEASAFDIYDESKSQKEEKIDTSLLKKDYHAVLPEYDASVLDRLNYTVRLDSWINEGIGEETLKRSRIGYFPGSHQITIPHFDANDRLVGVRGRFLAKEDCEKWGKYLPIRVGKLIYSHPVGMNLYNINKAKDNIARVKRAVVFESEKSCLKFATDFGFENDISVGCNGSNISRYHLQQLLDCGCQEMIIALDRQFQEKGDEEYRHLVNNLKKMHEKYKNDLLVSIIFDKDMITGYKQSPIDEGPDKFMKLYKERICL